MNRIGTVLICLATATSVAAAQGDTAPRQPVSAKDPSTAAIFSFLVTGLGEVYADEPLRGVALFATSVGGIVLAASTPWKTTACETTTATDPFGKPYQLSSCSTRNTSTKAILGLSISAGAWIASMIDAHDAARRYNDRHGLRVSLLPGPHSLGLGVSIATR